MEKSDLKISDIPAHIMTRLRNSFESDANVRQQRVKAQMLEQQGKFFEALGIKKGLEEVFTMVVTNYLKEGMNDSKRVALKNAGIPDKDVESLLTLCITAIMAIDIIDSVIMDGNDILARTDTTLSLDTFNGIKELGDKAKTSLSQFRGIIRYMDDVAWGDIVDNAYKMMRNKAGVILRKGREKGVL